MEIVIECLDLEGAFEQPPPKSDRQPPEHIIVTLLMSSPEASHINMDDTQRLLPDVQSSFGTFADNMAAPGLLAESIPVAPQADTVSIQSIEKSDQPPAAVTQDAELVTAKGNVITKDGIVFGNHGSDSDSSLNHKDNIFADPEVRDYYKQVYEDSQYECRHVFDAEATWSKEEERKVIRKLDWHGEW